MATDDDCTSLDLGDIRFYDNYVPSLGVGDYLINVSQLVNPTTNPPIDKSFTASQYFSVQGPRYTLPPSDIFSVFPPNNAQGVFEQFLPNVVLTQRELPWERNVFANPTTPWLALLLFVDGEQIGGQDALLTPPGSTVSKTKSTTIPAAQLYNNPTGDGVLWPNLQQEWYESEDYLNQTQCSIIDISPQAFETLLPSQADLPYLAHVRQVDPTSKDSEVLRINGDGWYSVVVGNRLPDAPPAGSTLPGQLNIVHLVSLEGLADYLSGTPLPQGTTSVRLISLKSWTFTCLPSTGESFGELMNGLLTDQQGNAKSTSFMLPFNPPADDLPETLYAAQAMQNGYVPLSYQTRQGEQTFAWYRGPFSPIPVQNFISSAQQSADDPADWQPFARASDAIIYDKTYGIFDVSYGVAWETGRLLALSNPYFGQKLLEWERTGHALIDLILERQSQLPASQNLDPSNPDPTIEKALLDQIQAYAVTDGFMSYLVAQFSAQIVPQFAGQPPASSQPPFPAYPTMPSPPANPQTIQDLLAEADVQNLVRQQGGQELESIVDWLAQLYLLSGVPFENLVPNPGLLAPESIAFFYVDSNWLDAMIEGALSIGIESSRDQLYQDLMKDLIWNTTFSAVQQVRDSLLGTQAQQLPPGSTVPLDQESLTGMLLRSALVSGWPGLQVDGYTQTLPNSAEPDITTQTPLLRMERLSSDVMLCLWPAVPVVVTVEEPHEGVAFGFEDQTDSATEGYYLNLRSLDPASYGTPLSGSQYSINAATSIIGTNGVIAITASGGLLSAIQSALPNSPTVNVRDFAVQMIKVPEQGVFTAESLAPASANQE